MSLTSPPCTLHVLCSNVLLMSTPAGRIRDLGVLQHASQRSRLHHLSCWYCCSWWYCRQYQAVCMSGLLVHVSAHHADGGWAAPPARSRRVHSAKAASGGRKGSAAATELGGSGSAKPKRWTGGLLGCSAALITPEFQANTDFKFGSKIKQAGRQKQALAAGEQRHWAESPWPRQWGAGPGRLAPVQADLAAPPVPAATKARGSIP